MKASIEYKFQYEKNQRPCEYPGCNNRSYTENHAYCAKHLPTLPQGMINATVVTLYQKGPQELTNFTDTLSEEQKKLARSHLKTYLQAQGREA